MAVGSYTLEQTVSFLETGLRAWGLVIDDSPVTLQSTRNALRRRFRELMGLYRAFLAVDADSLRPRSLVGPTTARDDDGPTWPGIRQERALSAWRDIQPQDERIEHLTVALRDAYESEDDDLVRPLIQCTGFTPLEIATRLVVEDRGSYFAWVLAYWERRHNVVNAPACPDTQPQRRRSIDRLFQALMRFIVGFFGSHKVDARNNP